MDRDRQSQAGLERRRHRFLHDRRKQNLVLTAPLLALAKTTTLRCLYLDFCPTATLTPHHTLRIYIQDAPNLQHALVSRAHGVADPEPAASGVIDQERSILRQGQYWYVIQSILAHSVFLQAVLRDQRASDALAFVAQSIRMNMSKLVVSTSKKLYATVPQASHS